MSPKQSLLLVILPCIVSAQPLTERTVRDVALDSAMRVTRLEMAACKSAHPTHAASFTASLDSVSSRLEKALDDMEPQRGHELAQRVPAAVAAGQDFMAALFGAEAKARPLEACLRNPREILALSEQEASGLMHELVTSVLLAIAEYKRGMDRVLR